MRTLLLVTVGAFLWLAGCGATSEEVISKEDLQDAISQQLTTEGHKHEGVTCEESVQAQATAATRCVMTRNGDEYQVTVIVKSVDGDQASYDLEIGQHPVS